MIRIPNQGEKGFTLIEIMIAMSILAVGLLSLYTAQGNSLRASGHAEKLKIASLLARQVMTEKMMEIQQDLVKGKLPEDKLEENGEFESPQEAYRWEYRVRAVEIPLAGDGGGGGDAGGTQPGGQNQAPEGVQKSMAQIVTKKISDSVREINVKIIWEDLGEENSITVTSHVSKL